MKNRRPRKPRTESQVYADTMFLTALFVCVVFAVLVLS